MTHGASLLLPGALNITTVAGDTATFQGEASGVVRLISYQETNGNISGSYTGTLTGLTTSPTVAISYFRSRSFVSIHMGTAQSGTSNTTAFTITGAPVAIRPTATRGNQYVPVQDNSSVQIGSVQMNTAGTLTFGLTAACNLAGFTASGTKGCQVSTFTYAM